MSERIPPCRFCGVDLRRAKARVIVREGQRGDRHSWGCCDQPDCLAQFDLVSPEARHKEEAPA